jgi:hypothetical protein
MFRQCGEILSPCLIISCLSRFSLVRQIHPVAIFILDYNNLFSFYFIIYFFSRKQFTQFPGIETNECEGEKRQNGARWQRCSANRHNNSISNQNDVLQLFCSFLAQELNGASIGWVTGLFFLSSVCVLDRFYISFKALACLPCHRTGLLHFNI